MNEDDVAQEFLELLAPTVKDSAATVGFLGRGERAERFLELMSRHGVTPRPPAREARAAPSLPPEVAAGWRRRYRIQFARGARALQQLEEIAAAFHERGVRVLALKGAAALLWVYGPECGRELADLDLLIEEESIAAAHDVLEGLGYSWLPQCHAPEFEPLRLRSGEESAFTRPGRFGVEAHLNFLQGKGDPRRALADVWGEAISTRSGTVCVGCLSAPHFLLHAAAHYAKHFEANFAPLKGLVDMALAVRKEGARIDWHRFWHTAERWGITREASMALATLQSTWGLAVPGLPAGAAPLPASVLVHGAPGAADEQAGRLPSIYMDRLKRARQLPDRAARARYLFRLVFPTPENLRHRYAIAPGHPVAPYYARHPLVLAGRLARGLGAAARNRARSRR
jgi:hypothetical protein